jgi:murein lipoprotein
MRKVLFALTAASLLAMSGCATQQSAQADKPAKPTITESAKASLAAAEAAVKDAKSKNALWTTADDALKAAKTAADKGDSAAVISNADKAKQHAELGLKQLSYPTQQMKDL